MDEDVFFTEPSNGTSNPHRAQVAGGKAAAVRRLPRGGLGDTGMNRGTAGAHPLVTETSGGGGLIQDGLLDEMHVKSMFEVFLKEFTLTDEERIYTTAGATSIGDDFDADLDAPARAGGRGRAVDGHYLCLIRRAVENPDDGGGGSERRGRALPIDLKHIQRFDRNLFKIAVQDAMDAIVYMDEVVAEIVSHEFEGLDGGAVGLQVALFNHPNVGVMRNLDPSHIETLVAIRGVVIRASQVIPDMQVAVFRCTGRVHRNQAVFLCGKEEARQLVNGEVQEPLTCPACQSKFSFELCHTKCLFGNKQLLKVQETPETIPEGETPHTVMAYVYDDLVDQAKPGDRVEITGIFKASGVRVVSKARNLKALFRTYIDINHIQKESLTRFQMGEDDNAGVARSIQEMLDNNEGDEYYGEGDVERLSAVYSSALIRKFKAIAADPNVYTNLANSLAPNIWESEDVKKGLLCQLFSGTPKRLTGGAGKSTRSDIHVLLCGDPSTAKSQLLQYVYNIAPRGVYTCGRGTSAVGLTASVSRDPETKDFVLESGAIVLSDRGICCIDEFDKMDDSARVILHEVMEQQTVSIAKAGIVCSLNARTSILASANPIQSKYDTRRSVIDNINLPPTLISRFDLIYLMLDTANEEIDRKLATHLCSLYSSAYAKTQRGAPLDRGTFAQFISYARRTCRPKLSDQASNELVQTYCDFRRKGADASGKSLSATPRQLESLIRISESLAKMQLASLVTVDHVKEAARLIQVATYNAVVDPLTGRIDFDQLTRGVSEYSRGKRDTVERLILEAVRAQSNGLDKEAVSKKVEELLGAAGHNEGERIDHLRELDTCLMNLESIGSIGKTSGGRFIPSVNR